MQLRRVCHDTLPRLILFSLGLVNARLFKIGALLILGVALASRLIPLVFESPITRAGENARLAGQFIAAHENEIHADHRFRNVHFALSAVRPAGHWSPAYCIVVVGNVASENDAQDLKRLLVAKRPPVQLSYQLDVSASHDTDLTMRTTFTPEEIRRMTANDLAALQKDFPPASENPWVDRMSHIIQDLNKLASQPEPNPVEIDQLEQRVSAFLAEDKRNKGMTPYLYMVRSLRPSGSPHP